MVSLSEREQRVLAEIEQDFNLNNRSLAAGLRDVRRAYHPHRLWRCSALFLAGIVLLLAGVTTAQVPVGVIGFVVMLVAAMSATPAVRVWAWAPALTRGVRKRFAAQVELARRERGRRREW